MWAFFQDNVAHRSLAAPPVWRATVPSPTQRQLSTEQVTAFAKEAFGVPVVQASPLSGGTFAAVWRVGLADQREVVLKVGPLPEVPIRGACTSAGAAGRGIGSGTQHRRGLLRIPR